VKHTSDREPGLYTLRGTTPSRAPPSVEGDLIEIRGWDGRRVLLRSTEWESGRAAARRASDP
jgi:hypothetical protein